jgi:hypothetical protein
MLYARFNSYFAIIIQGALDIAERVARAMPAAAAGKPSTSYVSCIDTPMQEEIQVYSSESIKISLCHLPLQARTVTRRASGGEIYVGISGNVSLKGLTLEAGAYDHVEVVEGENGAAAPPFLSPGKLHVSEKNIIEPGRPVMIARGAYFSCKADQESLYLKIETFCPADSLTCYAWSSGNTGEPVEMAGAPQVHRFTPGSFESEDMARRFSLIIRNHNLATNSITNGDLSLYFRRALKESFYYRCHTLSENIAYRSKQNIAPQDSMAVRGITEALCLWISNGGSLFPENETEWGRLKPLVIRNCYAGEQVEVMRRVVLYDSPVLQIRAHMFPSGAETFIHNHGGSFFSVCLRGFYYHHTWCPDAEDITKTYTVREREHGGKLTDPVEVVGNLRKNETFLHSTLNMYYLNSSSYHTVEVPTEKHSTSAGTKNTSRIMTLFIKDKTRASKTLILSPEGGDLDLGSGSEVGIKDGPELTRCITDFDSFVTEAAQSLLSHHDPLQHFAFTDPQSKASGRSAT